MSLLLQLLTSWKVIVITVFFMLALPLIFYLSSLDRKKLSIKRKKRAKAPKPVETTEVKSEEEDNIDQEIL